MYAKSPTLRALTSLKVLLVCTLVLPATLFAWAAYGNYNAAFEAASRRLGQTTDLVYEHVVKVLETHELVLDQVEVMLGGLPDDEILAHERDLHERLWRLTARMPQVLGVFVHDREGRPLVTGMYYPLPRPGRSVTDLDYFARQREADQGSYIGAPARGRLDGVPYINLSRRRPGAEFNGTIAVSVSPDYYQKFFGSLAQEAPEDELGIALFRTDGVLLVRVPDLWPEVRAFNPSSKFFGAFQKHPDRGTFRSEFTPDGLQRLVAYRTLPGYPVAVSVTMPVGAIVRAWARDIASHLVFGIPATAALFLVTLFALRRAEREVAAVALAHAESDARRQAEQAMQRGKRLEALGRLAGGVAHDFNNLLLVISGNANMLRRGLGDAKKRMDAIERAAKAGSRLTRQLLAFSRQQPLRPRPIDLRERLATLREIIGSTLRGDIALAVDFPNDLWLIEADPGELELAILNLASNARDAMPRGGSLLVEARNEASDAPDAAGDCVVLTFRDTGEGMPPEAAARAFEPFFTTKAVGRGTGLGLSQVYGFATQAGGTASIESAVGQGTSVILRLPKARSASRDEPKIEALHGAAREDTALLVEDNVEVADVTTSMLEEIGYSVIHVADVGKAREMLTAGVIPFRLVVSDIMFGTGADGIELARELRLSHPDLPVVLVTGYSEAASDASAEGYTIIAKPFSRVQLEQAIHAHARAARHAA